MPYATHPSNPGYSQLYPLMSPWKLIRSSLFVVGSRIGSLATNCGLSPQPAEGLSLSGQNGPGSMGSERAANCKATSPPGARIESALAQELRAH